MPSPIYFEFLAGVWDQFPPEDRELYAELWQGYEQVIAAVYQKYVELNLNISISDMKAWTAERWLPYHFNPSSFIQRPASLTSNQDLSQKYNASARYLLRIQVDEDTPFEVDIRGEASSLQRFMRLFRGSTPQLDSSLLVERTLYSS